jgi:uncharacterized membrane protein
MIKAIYEKHIANSSLSDEKLKFSSKIRNKTKIITLTILFNMVLKFLARITKQEREKSHPNWKGKQNMTYWARWYMPIILVTWETEAGES